MTDRNSTLIKNYLNTGGCDFLGTTLIKHIRVLDNLTVGTKEDLSTASNFTEINISELSPYAVSLSPQS